MRVLYVNHTSEMSGAERSLLTLLSGLPGDVEPVLACPPGSLWQAAAEREIEVIDVPEISAGLRLHPGHTAGAMVDIVKAATALRRLARRLGTDLVHANSLRAGIAASLARKMGGPPVVVHVRDCMPQSPVADMTRRLISRAASMVIANSRYTAANFARRGVSPRVRVVYNSVDPRRFGAGLLPRDEARRRLGLDRDSPVLGVVAQITPWKAQDDAVRALFHLRSRWPEARLLLVGEAKFRKASARYDNIAYSESLQHMVAELGLVDDAVDFMGERGDLAAILRAMDVVLVPSWEEPFGVAVIEAMAMGVPVLATNVGGPAEIVRSGHEGVTLPPRQPERWAQVLDELLARPGLRAEMGVNGRQRVADAFSPQGYVDGVMRVYRDLDQPGRDGLHLVAKVPGPEVSTERPDANGPGTRRPEPLRVLYVNHTSEVSGAERGLLNLLAGLPSEISPVVACPEGSLAESVREIGVPVVDLREIGGSLRLHPWHTTGTVWEIWNAARFLSGTCRRLGIDLVHANTVRAGLVASLAARRGGPPAVVHVHDCLPATRTANLSRHLLSSGAKLIFANSHYTASSFAGTADHGLQVVYNSVDCSRFDPATISRDDARFRLGLDRNSMVLGMVAQITPWKAQEDAIRILAHLRRTQASARLLVVGEAKFRGAAARYDNIAYGDHLLQLVSELDVADAVDFLGEREDVPEILRSLDFLLLPSWEEPFGVAIIEAMAMQVPVLATEVGGPGEIITTGKDGLLLPPREPERWAEVIDQLAANPKRCATMGRRGRVRALGGFSGEAYVHGILAGYQKVLPAPLAGADQASAGEVVGSGLTS